MTAPTRFSASAPLKSLGLRPGDTLVVYQADDDVVTVAFNRPTAHRGTAQLAREFAQRWTGQFPVPVSTGDDRLEHIIAKHVK
jgi:RNase H-fold protein (predicted Holliday junction resolvase)